MAVDRNHTAGDGRGPDGSRSDIRLAPRRSSGSVRPTRNPRRVRMARLNVNGRIRDVQVEADTPLLWVLREQVGLTGTKYGCGVAQCGACSVHINGGLARSCSIPVGSVK